MANGSMERRLSFAGKEKGLNAQPHSLQPRASLQQETVDTLLILLHRCIVAPSRTIYSVCVSVSVCVGVGMRIFVYAYVCVRTSAR